jgi:hypothetical protein
MILQVVATSKARVNVRSNGVNLTRKNEFDNAIFSEDDFRRQVRIQWGEFMRSTSKSVRASRTGWFWPPILCLLLASPWALAENLEDGKLAGPFGGKDPDWGRVVFLNGVRTTSDEATSAAEELARALNKDPAVPPVGIHLIYNDLRMEGFRAVDQGIAVTIEKLGDNEVSVNKATENCLTQIRQTCESGKTIWLVGHSAGTLSIQNAVIAANEFWKANKANDRLDYLSRIKIVYLGGAVFRNDNLFADEVPRSVARFDIHDYEDGVAELVGPGEWGEAKAEAHYLRANYAMWLTRKRFGQTGELIIRNHDLYMELVKAADDPKEKVLRIRVADLRAHQESRRTHNFELPWQGTTVAWRIVDHPAPKQVCFTIMRDTIPFDAPKSKELVDSSTSEAFSGNDNYVGRVGYPGRDMQPADEDAFWKIVPKGFILEARPLDH